MLYMLCAHTHSRLDCFFSFTRSTSDYLPDRREEEEVEVSHLEASDALLTATILG